MLEMQIPINLGQFYGVTNLILVIVACAIGKIISIGGMRIFCEIFACNPQIRFSIIVWCGLMGSKNLRPVFYSGVLTGVRYLGFLRKMMQNLLDYLNLGDRQGIFFQQDCVPPPSTQSVHNLMNELYIDKLQLEIRESIQHRWRYSFKGNKKSL